MFPNMLDTFAAISVPVYFNRYKGNFLQKQNYTNIQKTASTSIDVRRVIPAKGGSLVRTLSLSSV